MSAVPKPRAAVLNSFPRMSNLTYRPYFTEQNTNSNQSNSTQNTISSLPNSATNSTESRVSNSMINGTVNGLDRKSPGKTNGEVSGKSPPKKTKTQPVSIPTSPPTDRHAVPEPSVTSRVGKYKIIRTLGRGNFAQVKLAIHVATGREVAIKMIDKSSLNDNCRIKLTREVNVLKTLTHPNIVGLYEVIETPRHVYLVMEYAKNGEVFEHLLKAGRMAETKVRVIFRQLFSAVEYCHQKNIVHRDLKAENLLLDENNNLKLADFGFANTFKEGNTLDTFCGSPPYAAPELLCGQKYHGPEVDVWALGVILYMLVCGQLPFEALNLKELHSRVLSGKYRIPFYMSGACEEMLKKMLVLNPGKRATLRELMDEKWINVGYENEPLKPYVEPPLDYSDPIRRALMNELGFKPEDLQDAFDNRRFNNVTATYLLLADTETRHRLTRKLQNQCDASKGLQQNNLSSDLEVESSDDDRRLGTQQRSHSALVSNVPATMDSLVRRSWVTGSLRDREPQTSANFYSKPNKQLCRPSLNLPSLIAKADKSDTAFPRFPVNLELTTKNNLKNTPVTDTECQLDASDAEMDSVAPATPNGLRRFRTQSLERKNPRSTDSANVTVSTVVNLKKPEQIRPTKLNGNQTDPLTRREILQPQPATRSRSIVIVSGSPNNSGYKTFDSSRKLPRVISPVEAKYDRNNVVDPLNPSEREKHYYLSARHLVSPPTQRAYRTAATRGYTGSNAIDHRPEGRLGSYEGTKSKPVLARWAHMMSTDPLHTGKLNSSTASRETEQSIIIISDKEDAPHSKTTRVLTPTAKPIVQSRRSLSRGGSERIVQLNINGFADKPKPHMGRAERMPKWRRYTAELPGSMDKPPTPAPRAFVRDSVYANTTATNNGTRNSVQTHTNVVYGTRQNSTDLGDGKLRIIDLHNAGMRKSNGTAHLHRQSVNGIPANSGSQPNGSSNYETGLSRVVFCSPVNGMDTTTRVTDSNAIHSNGIVSPTHKIQFDSGVNRSLIWNGDKRSTPTYDSLSRTDRRLSSPVNALATTRTNDAPVRYHGLNGKNAVTLTGAHRSQTQRGSMELNKPTALLTSSNVVPEFTRIYNGNSPVLSGRESRSSDSRQSDLGSQQHRTNTEVHNVESPRHWRAPLSMSPSPTNRQASGSQMVPRRQNWEFGISVQGRNAQVLMLSTLKILEDKSIDYVHLNPYRLVCTHPSEKSINTTTNGQPNTANTIKWEMEVVQLPQINTFGVRFKYLSGATTRYRALEKAIISEFPKTMD